MKLTPQTVYVPIEDKEVGIFRVMSALGDPIVAMKMENVICVHYTELIDLIDKSFDSGRKFESDFTSTNKEQFINNILK